MTVMTMAMMTVMSVMTMTMMRVMTTIIVRTMTMTMMFMLIPKNPPAWDNKGLLGHPRLR
jgi:hypothetical protein